MAVSKGTKLIYRMRWLSELAMQPAALRRYHREKLGISSLCGGGRRSCRIALYNNQAYRGLMGSRVKWYGQQAVVLDFLPSTGSSGKTDVKLNNAWKFWGHSEM